MQLQVAQLIADRLLLLALISIDDGYKQLDTPVRQLGEWACEAEELRDYMRLTYGNYLREDLLDKFRLGYDLIKQAEETLRKEYR